MSEDHSNVSHESPKLKSSVLKVWPANQDEIPSKLVKTILESDGILQLNSKPNSKEAKKGSPTMNGYKLTALKKFSEDLQQDSSASEHEEEAKHEGQEIKEPKLKNLIKKEIPSEKVHEKISFIGTFHTEKYQLMKGYLDGSDKQLRLYYTRLEPFGNRIASICFIHGFGEHSGRFMEFADFFAKQGFVIHLIDLRGYGHSGGARANGSVEEFHHDVELLIRQANRNLPLFIYAHSMGASILTSLLIRNPYLHITGVILTSGLFAFPKERPMPWIKKAFVKIIGTHVEELMINASLNTTSLTQNNDNIIRIFQDRLMMPLVGVRNVKAILEMIEFNVPNASKFKYPCLIVHGNNDTVTNYRASVKLFKGIVGQEKQLEIFEDGFHELHLDDDREKLKLMVLEWMQKRLENSPKNLGEFNTLKVGLKDNNKYKKMILTAILMIVYFGFLKHFRGHKMYNTKLKLFLYPLFYLINIFFRRHGIRL
jgi:alpha-beta hydrolase superfamily lysophospholipase